MTTCDMNKKDNCDPECTFFNACEKKPITIVGYIPEWVNLFFIDNFMKIEIVKKLFWPKEQYIKVEITIRKV